jgi:predicted RNA-binding Zn-ribbon protein involved in translation (DUF1610 family)
LYIIPGGIALGIVIVAVTRVKNKKQKIKRGKNKETGMPKKKIMTYTAPPVLSRFPSPDQLKQEAVAKKTGKSIADEIPLEHQVDEATEKEVMVEVKKETCIVCTNELKGTSFHCPKCSTKYCLRCAKVLAEKGEECWTCRTPLKIDE